MKEIIFPFLIRLLAFTIILYLLQFFITGYSLKDINMYYSLTAIYLFHFFATLLVYLFLVFVHKKFKDYTGFAFMGGSFFKMLAAILFLLPMLLQKTGDAFINLISFFIPYFMFLFFETFYAVKLINSK